MICESSTCFVSSLVYKILSWQVLEMESAHDLGIVVLKIKDKDWQFTWQKPYINYCYCWNLGYNPWTTVETAVKWMEASILFVTQNILAGTVNLIMIFGYGLREITLVDLCVKQVWQQIVIVISCKNCAENCTKIEVTCSIIEHSVCIPVYSCT